jgi:hypothetical protein
MNSKNTDKEKATACQKTPDMAEMIQRSKDYGLKVAVPNMKTDTQTAPPRSPSAFWHDKYCHRKAQADKLAEACKAVTKTISDNGRVEADDDAVDLCWQALAEYEAAQ